MYTLLCQSLASEETTSDPSVSSVHRTTVLATRNDLVRWRGDEPVQESSRPTVRRSRNDNWKRDRTVAGVPRTREPRMDLFLRLSVNYP